MRAKWYLYWVEDVEKVELEMNWNLSQIKTLQNCESLDLTLIKLRERQHKNNNFEGA